MYDMSTDVPLVQAIDIWMSRGQNDILKGVSIEAKRGEVIALLGPSGAGKSTLLRCLNAIDFADRGLAVVDGQTIGCRKIRDRYVRLPERELSRQRAEIGMVFQNFNLFPHMSVLANIMDAPMRVRGMSHSEAENIARNLLERVKLSDKADAYPRHLSGGQQQRIAIARALAMKPKVMLFDEPTSALDPHLTEEVLQVIRELAESGMTMIIVTHEVQFARDIAHQVAVMGDGVIMEMGPPEQVLRNPKDPRVQTFLARSLESSN